MIVKSFAIIKEEDRFLLIREAALKWKGKWFLPGGKVDEGEDPVEAAIRETKEEAGVSVNIHGIAYIRFREKIFSTQLSLFYAASISSGQLKTIADRHSLEARWFTLSEIKGLFVRQKLIDILMRYTPGDIMPPDNFKIYPDA